LFRPYLLHQRWINHIVSRNSTRHGFFSTSVLLPEEDKEEFLRLARRLASALWCAGGGIGPDYHQDALFCVNYAWPRAGFSANLRTTLGAVSASRRTRQSVRIQRCVPSPTHPKATGWQFVRGRQGRV
jgi:hypothetical protein